MFAPLLTTGDSTMRDTCMVLIAAVLWLGSYALCRRGGRVVRLAQDGWHSTLTMRNTCMVLIAAVLLLGSYVPAAGAAASSALPRMESAFDIPRSDTQDTVYFRSEDVLQGQVLTEKIGLVTQYGTLSIPLRRCAGLSFETARATTDAVVTVNFNRLTGIVTDHVFRFRIGSSGAEVSLRKETIAFILLKKTPDETSFLQGKDKPDLFLMANGDLLSGKAAEQTVDLRTDYGKVPVPFSEIKEVRLLGEGDVTAIVTKTSGDSDSGGVGNQRDLPESGNRADPAGRL